jgi:hypothetical protein
MNSKHDSLFENITFRGEYEFAALLKLKKRKKIYELNPFKNN